VLNPKSLDIISEPILFQIDPTSYNLYEISEDGAKYSSSLYENDAILRSLLLKQDTFNSDFLNELYQLNETDRIYYILNYDQKEKYILSFKLPTKDNDIVFSTLNSLRDSKAEIINWIRKNCEVSQNTDFFKETQAFPRYNVPDIICEIIQNNEAHKANLKDVQISGLLLECEIDLKLENECEINFNIGKTSYILPCLKIWESTDSERRFKKAGFQIDFDGLVAFKKWKTFIMALHLRSQKNS
jgi:hypothetical protein